MKSFSELADMIQQKEEVKQRLKDAEEIERKKTARRDDAVVGGIFKPAPVDRASALLLAKANWLSLPNVLKQIKGESVMPETGYKLEREGECLDIGKEKVFPKLVNGEQIYDMVDAAKAFIAHCKTIDPELYKVSGQAADCRKTIDESIANVGGSIEEFDRVTKDAAHNVKMQRMSIVSECAYMVNALKDVRQFFLGPDYEREQKRLVEFVDLCERLKGLKDSGFLDTVADTMIRLASYEK